jgi:hypothetical protein
VSVPSCEMKLRLLASANAPLVAALTFATPAGPNAFLWFDRQLQQGDIGKQSDNRTAVAVKRVSTAPRAQNGNQGGAVQNIAQVRIQIDITDYNAERARQVAQLVTNFMQSISLLSAGEFSSPVTQPSQNPNFLLNERSGMLFNLQPPAYTHIQDWRIWNNQAVPAS